MAPPARKTRFKLPHFRQLFDIVWSANDAEKQYPGGEEGSCETSSKGRGRGNHGQVCESTERYI